MPFRPKTHRPQPIKPAAKVNYDRQRPSSHARGYNSPEWRATRKRVALRDRYTCQGCGATVGLTKGDFHCDHIVPKSAGGSEDDSNLRTLCLPCHSRKTAKEDGGFGHRKQQ